MSHQWIPMHGGSNIPHNPCYVGNDSDGTPIYVGRAFHEGDQIPAKALPSKQIAYISHGGQEIPKHQYEMLTGFGFQWVPSSNGHTPHNAVFGGQTSSGEPLFIGRSHHQGSLTPGKIHKSHGCMYFPYGGAECSTVHYEVLVGSGHGGIGGGHQPIMPGVPIMPGFPSMPGVRSQWIQSSAHTPCPPGAHCAGNDSDGTPMYIGRAFHEGDQLPAKVLPNKQIAFICHNGQEVPKHHFEILCYGNVSWVPSAHGYIPPNAVPGGRTSTGEPLYIGRAPYMGSITVGKVHPSHQTLYIPYGGSEIPIKTYEVLIEH